MSTTVQEVLRRGIGGGSYGGGGVVCVCWGGLGGIYMHVHTSGSRKCLQFIKFNTKLMMN